MYNTFIIKTGILLSVLINVVECTKGFTIPSPRSYKDKIVIVGAGASGIHMALSLKEKGFTNVEILEKGPFIGGKSWTIGYRGANHEMGAVYLSPDYKTNVIPLVKKYVPNDLVHLPSADVWLDNLLAPIKFDQYVAYYSMKYYNTTDYKVSITRLGKALIKYVLKHKEIFGDYEGDLMPEPTPEVQRQINGTFLDFLKRNNIDSIASLLYAASSVQGYGRLDEIACLYGMMWNTPELMNSLLKRLSGNATNSGIYMLKNGFGNLWKTIVQKEKLNIVQNVDILGVYRTKHNQYKDIWIDMKIKNGANQWKHYDFIIWSPEMKTSLKYWSNKEISKERLYFSLTDPTYFTTALVDTEGVRKGPCPVDYFFDNINKKRESSFWAQRDTFAAINDYKGLKYQNNDYPSGNDTKSIRTTITYQMSDNRESYTRMKHNLKTSLQKIGATKIHILRMKIWRYFPRYSPADIEKGYLWRVLEMQGQYGMWYIGSSVSFESVKSVIEYNKLLMKKMELPK